MLKVKAGEDQKVVKQLTAAGFEACLVSYEVTTTHHRTKAKLVKDRLAFPGYVFVKSSAVPVDFDRVPGALRYLGYDERGVYRMSNDDFVAMSRAFSAPVDATAVKPLVVAGQTVKTSLFGLVVTMLVVRVKGHIATLHGVISGKKVSVAVPQTMCYAA